MAVSKVRVERKANTGAFFGGVEPRGEWTMPEDKQAYQDIKKNWQAYQAEQRLINEQYAAEQEKRTLSGQYQAGTQAPARSALDNTRNVQEAYTQPAAQSYTAVPVVRRKKKKKASAVSKVTGRTKATVVGGWVNGWAFFWYATVQLPFALLSAAGLGMAYAVYESISAIIGETLAHAAIAALIKAGGVTAGVIEATAKLLFHIDFDPMLLFITPYILIFAFGLLQLVICWFVYSATGIKSLSGRGAAAKNILFLVAGVGMVLPVLNLFPLILLWTLYVSFRPK